MHVCATSTTKMFGRENFIALGPFQEPGCFFPDVKEAISERCDQEGLFKGVGTGAFTDDIWQKGFR